MSKIFFADGNHEHMVAPGMIYISQPTEYGTLYTLDELKNLAKLSEAFYIGGTKCGAYFGEAVVLRRNLIPHFFTIIKQRGALLAKGRILGVQFDTLFTDELYLKIGRRAIDAAEKIRAALKRSGYEFYIESPTNQIFVVVSDEQPAKLSARIEFSFWEKISADKTVIRLATSRTTRAEDVDLLIEELER